MGTPGNPLKDKFGHAAVPVDYSPASPANAVSFLLNRVGPPSPLYLQRDDVLLIVVTTNSAAAETINLTGRLLLTNGVIMPFQDQLSGISNHTAIAFSKTLAEGWLLAVSATATNALMPGQCFVQCHIVRGNIVLPPTNLVQTLFASYATQRITASWPGGRVNHPCEGPGARVLNKPGNPAAGADFQIVMPSNTRWAVRSMTATLTTSAAVANRQVRGRIVDTTNSLLYMGAPNQNIPASTVATVSFSPSDGGSVVVPTLVTVPLPVGATMYAGDKIGPLTLNLDAADQWSNIVLETEEWWDNQ